MKMETEVLRNPGQVHSEVARWREDFPVLRETVHGKPLVYLDNAATTHKPVSVIEAEAAFYRHTNSNVHRGVHTLSQRATDQYEEAREKVRRFINAANTKEIIFVRGTTEAINLVAQSFGRPRLTAEDNIIVSAMEHHSNIVPWQMVCGQTGAELRVAPVNEAGEVDVEMLGRLIGPKTKLVAITHLSNALGSITPVKRIIKMAHAQQVPVLLDGAQAIAHLGVDVKALDCDFYAFSGHKIYAPTGIGVLYGKEAWLDAMPPYQGGGDMISSVTFGETHYNDLPYKFEAGTPNIAGAIGLGHALDYVSSLGIGAIAAHEHDLLEYATGLANGIKGLKIIGTAREKASILSFTLEGVHPHDIGTILDHDGIAIRAGHHCAMPIMQRFGLAGTARASFSLYNTRAEVDALMAGIARVQEMFQR
ncbi:MAG TPA: cysteine desulfurase [Noviherbaspirillum sp.]|uniref:cysteine desulfurase n=1 Tax=Noviherbaspirillum sp. TaxID=1926288 RepID=UPI002B477676|nr:cysteine desulfurase [Noviherbaspirillum sp.]HJV84261.1 cysteine desulfurase [Noviherbaspirillum sp.]